MEVMACSDDPQDSSTPRNLKSIIIRLSEGEARRSHFSSTLHYEIEFGQRTSQDRQWLPSVKLATAAT